MINTNEKLGAFIVPTGIGASIGGYAGDASCYAQKFSEFCKLIVNPNVVNAGGFSGINSNMFYVEGYSLDNFFKGKIKLNESKNNKIGIIFDKNISKDLLNIHINTMNAVKTVYGIDIIGYEITDNTVGVEFFVDNSGISTGRVKNPETLLCAGKKLLSRNADALAVVCSFDESNDINYENGDGVDPVGGVEAIISHYLSRELKIPVAHSPAFEDYSASTKIVNPKSAAEYITPTFLPCVLLGLNNAPKISDMGIGIENLDFLIMPFNSLGSVPVFECLKNNIKIFAIKENCTLLNVTNEKLFNKCGIKILSTYNECLEQLKNDYTA